MNPYRFVPLGSAPQRLPFAELLRGHLSGSLVCDVQLHSPLLRGAGRSAQGGPEPKNSQSLLPGSLLRGAVREVAEAVSSSCLPVFDGVYERQTVHYERLIPSEFAMCNTLEALCPACGLFGPSPVATRVRIASRLHISDATLTQGAEPQIVLQPALPTPKPHHRSFYLGEDGNIAGRKFYYHRPSGVISPATREHGGRECVLYAKNTYFRTIVEFANITDTELKLLLYSLFLSEGLGHKLGAAKGLGYGSVTCTLVRAELYTAESKLLGHSDETLEGEDAVAWYRTLTCDITERDDPTARALRDVLSLTPPEPTQYPSIAWFRNNPQAPLVKIIEPAPVAPTQPWRPSHSELPAVPVERRPQPVSTPAPAPRRTPAPKPSPSTVSRSAERPRAPESPQEHPATLNDLLQHFKGGTLPPSSSEKAGTTNRSQKAREEQRKLLERLRGQQR